MTAHNEHSETTKISPAFRVRLERFKPGQNVRAILLFDLNEVAPGSSPRTPQRRRQAVARAIDTAKQVLPEIDAVLQQLDGRRLGDPSALGTITIEAPAKSILKLEECPVVRAILEDQVLSFVR